MTPKHSPLLQKDHGPLLWIGCMTLAGSLAWMPHAMAADVQPVPDDQVAELPGVTVTARRREETVMQVPISVTVVNADEAKGAAMPTHGNAGLARDVPNLSFADNGGQFSNLFSIRGVGSFAPVSSDDTSVVMYLDEVPRSVYGAPATLLDIDRVEVLRGPQGTLFGRNTQGGAINVIPNAPSFKRSFSTTLEAGSHGHRLGEFVANGALSETVAGRLAVQYSNLDGTVPNISAGGKDGRTQVGAVRGSLLWLPSDRTTVTLTGFHDRRESDATRYIWLQNPSFPQSAVNPKGNIRWQDTGASLKVEHDFDKVRLTSLTSFQESKSFQPFDLTDGLIYSAMTGMPQQVFDTPYADYADIHYRERTAQQEFRLSSLDEGSLTWTTGVNLFRSRFDNDTWSKASPAAFNFLTQNGAQENRIKTDSVAVFGEGTLALTDRLKATLGARYTHEKKTADYTFTGNGHPSVVPYFQDRQRLSDSFLSGRAGLSYEINPDFTTYATVSRGVVSAGYTGVAVNSSTGRPEPSYPTSKSWTYEAGFKSLWLDRRVSLNGSVFYNDVKNGHVIVFNPAALMLTAASLDYKSKGAELEAAANLTKGLKLTAGIGYTHTELVNVPANSATGAVSGNRVPNVPRLSTSLGMQYETPMRLGMLDGTFTGALVWQHQSKRAVDVKESFDLPGYSVVNARLGWRQGRWQVYAFAWNLFDKQYLVSGQSWTTGVSSARLGQPRTVGLGMTVDF